MKSRPTVMLVGAGGFGIHHLEGLLTARTPLSIYVVDRSAEALAAAKKLGSGNHSVAYSTEIPSIAGVDVAIVATTSGARAAAVRALFAQVSKVRYLLLEKILFDTHADYALIENLLKKRRVKAWVNSPLPLFPFHSSLRHIGTSTCHIVGGARYALMTNIIHYAHFAAHLAGSAPRSCDTSLLTPNIIASKRSGYLELMGTLTVTFKNGARLIATTLPNARARTTVILGRSVRATIDESTGTAQIAKRSTHWKWKEVPAPFLKQSDMTGPVVEQLLKKGTCDLPTYAQSRELHLVILGAVKKFLKQHKHRTKVDYPFT